MATGAVSHSARTAFERAIESFQAKMNPKDRDLFTTVTNAGDITALVLDMEKEHTRRGVAQNIARIDPFIKFLKRYEKVIEVFVGVSGLSARISPCLASE